MMSRKIAIAFLSFFLVSNLYLDLTLYEVESIYLIVFIFYLLSESYVKLIILLSLLVILYILTMFFSGIPGSFNSQFFSFLQFVTAILVFISLWKYSYCLEKEQFNKIVFSLLVIVFAISFIQYLNIDSKLISEWRKIIHPGVYDLSVEYGRDESITLAGVSRPIGLAKESSYLSIFVAFCGYSILVLGSVRQKIIYFMIFVFFFYTNTSPMLGLVFVVWGLHLFFNAQSNQFKVAAIIWFVLMVGLALFVLKQRFEIVTNKDLGWDFLIQAYNSGLITTESSLGIRLFNPFFTMFNVLKDNPLLGAGFSNIPFIETHSDVLIFHPKNVLSNAIASGFIYIGILGMFLVLIFLKPFLRVSIKVFISYSVALSFCGGGFFTIRYWFLLFLFLLVYVLAKGMNENDLSEKN